MSRTTVIIDSATSRRPGWLSRGILSMAVLFYTAAIVTAGNVYGGQAETGKPVATQEPQLGCCPDFSHVARPQDKVWLVSTRHLGCPCGGEPDLAVWRYEGSQWQDASLAALTATDAPDVLTIVQVHGNRIDHDWAVDRGWAVYHEMIRRAPDAGPMRFIIYSWPSSKVRGQLRDVRAKAARTEAEGYYLGWILSGFDPRQNVTLMGHSFGSRVITGACHMLGGGTLSGRTLPADRQLTGLRVRAVLMASAMPNYWLSPGAYHDRAVSQMERVLILYNHCDPYLKFYRFTDRCCRAEALGYTGLCGGLDPDVVDRVREMDVAPWIGKAHSWMQYLCTPGLMDEAAPYVFGNTLDVPIPPEPADPLDAAAAHLPSLVRHVAITGCNLGRVGLGG